MLSSLTWFSGWYDVCEHTLMQGSTTSAWCVNYQRRTKGSFFAPIMWIRLMKFTKRVSHDWIQTSVSRINSSTATTPTSQCEFVCSLIMHSHVHGERAFTDKHWFWICPRFSEICLVYEWFGDFDRFEAFFLKWYWWGITLYCTYDPTHKEYGEEIVVFRSLL